MRNLTERRQSNPPESGGQEWDDDELFPDPPEWDDDELFPDPPTPPNNEVVPDPPNRRPSIPRPGGEERPERPERPGIGSQTSDYITDLILQTQNSLSPITDYFKDLMATRRGEQADLDAITAELQQAGNDPTEWAKRKLELGAFPIVDVAVKKAREGTAFLRDFMNKTKQDLASAKIPKSPKRDLGEPSPLRARINTRGFYS
jgi:hypothetical protein